jgi:hypothetical protein
MTAIGLLRHFTDAGVRGGLVTVRRYRWRRFANLLRDHTTERKTEVALDWLHGLLQIKWRQSDAVARSRDLSWALHSSRGLERMIGSDVDACA